ncbi:SidG protein, substrate of the Dot/Icm system [Legionella santicrucis]|uniref:SidG protein, substrate of the Dot/Icm system n=1 Tax=Legionella santicrucis TaxID=45074 RepID=A0A0W0Z3F7_9GAMM|nr:hypothetical protein [Legionella santicrucis]KTD63672.1 SidG protein, substrate of the Dot/Icm system [Legionella santicrucis]
MPKSKVNQGLFGITVQTWGTKDKQSNGMINFMDQQLFGGDVGHASINMKLPINEDTKKWIEQYCCKESYEKFKTKNGDVSYERYLEEVEKAIPFSQKKQEVRKAQFNESGALQTSQERAYEQEYFDIDFSWWPSRVSTTTMDMIKEREGKHVNYAEEWRDYLQPVQRLHRGKIGQRLMDYDPLTVTHQRDLPDFILERMKKRNSMEKNDEKLNAITLLEKKIGELTSTTFGSTMKLMFKNIGIDGESLKKEFYEGNKQTDNIEELKTFLIQRVSDTKSNLINENENLKTQLEDSSDIDALQQKIAEISESIKTVADEITEIKRDERLDDLHAIFNEANGPIPFTGQVDSIVNGLPELKDLLKLQYGTISANSVTRLIAHIDNLIIEKQAKDQSTHAQTLEKIAKYEEICKLPENEQEDALWDEGLNDVNIDELRNQIKSDSGSIEPLKQIKSELLNYQNDGLSFSAEWEVKFNQVMTDWHSAIDEPCQFITPESSKQIAATALTLKTTRDEGIVEKQSTQDKFQSEHAKLKRDLAYFEEFEAFFEDNSSAYSTLGRAPHHTVSLPLQTDTSRGLSPVEMLKKMHELIVEDPEKFNLYKKNCSLTSMEVLKAGAKHDPYLLQVMDTPALGFFGTPQQVLTNAQNAQAAIDNQKTNTILKTLNPDRYLDRALGYGISLYMEKDSSKLQQALGITIGSLVSVAKLPGIIADAVLDPTASLDDLVDTLDLIYERDSTKLKVGMTILSSPALVCLGAMSGIQKTFELAATPFKFLYHKLSHQPKESMDLITVPVGGYKQEESASSSYTNTALASLVNQGIKQKLDANTITIAKQKNPKDTLDAFAKALSDNPKMVVVLDAKAHTQLLSYVLKPENAEQKQLFYKCCNQSVAQAAAFEPKTKEGIREFIPEERRPQQTQTNEAVEEVTMENNELEEEEMDEHSALSMSMS